MSLESNSSFPVCFPVEKRVEVNHYYSPSSLPINCLQKCNPLFIRPLANLLHLLITRIAAIHPVELQTPQRSWMGWYYPSCPLQSMPLTLYTGRFFPGTHTSCKRLLVFIPVVTRYVAHDNVMPGTLLFVNTINRIIARFFTKTDNFTRKTWWYIILRLSHRWDLDDQTLLSQYLHNSCYILQK